jgi:hypothetical protein
MDNDNTNNTYDRGYKALKVLGTLAAASVFSFMLFKEYQKITEPKTPIESNGFPQGTTIVNTLLPTNGKVVYVKKDPNQKYDSTMVDPATREVRYSGSFPFRIKGDNNHKPPREGNGDVWVTFPKDNLEIKVKK